VGDDVNLASRLEGQTKVYGMTTIISEATQEQLPGFATLELDLLRVKGKASLAASFGVMGDETVAAEDWFQDLSRDHHAMLAAYRRQDWSAAEALSSACAPRPKATCTTSTISMPSASPTSAPPSCRRTGRRHHREDEIAAARRPQDGMPFNVVASSSTKSATLRDCAGRPGGCEEGRRVRLEIVEHRDEPAAAT